MYDDHVYLYVDDENLSREVMRLVMREALGVEHLHIFEDSQDFIARLEKLMPRPDVIMLDVQVKPLNGLEMLRLLQAHHEFRHAQVIAVTASVMSDEINELRSAGFDGAIAKPVRISSFPAVLERILHGEKVWFVGS